MIRFYAKLGGLLLLAWPLLAAAPFQEEPLANLPWWVWLVAVAALLLLLFIVIIAFDWSSNRETDRDENE